MNDYHDKLRDRLENLKGVKPRKESRDNIEFVLPNKKALEKHLQYVDNLGIKDEIKRVELALIIHNNRFNKKTLPSGIKN